MHIIISCSLNSNSNSRQMALHAHGLMAENSRFIDLRDYPLPLCDASSDAPPMVKSLIDAITPAHSILFAGPVYNYGLNAAAKNLIEWTGKAWSNKVVGLLLAAGGKNSFMAPLSFMNSLMLDFRCIIVPRYVYADRSQFQSNEIDSRVESRIKELVRYTEALGHTLYDFHKIQS